MCVGQVQRVSSYIDIQRGISSCEGEGLQSMCSESLGVWQRNMANQSRRYAKVGEDRKNDGQVDVWRDSEKQNIECGIAWSFGCGGGVGRGEAWLRWFGHLERKSPDDWVAGCRDLEVDGVKRKGRSRKTWGECVRNDMVSLGLKRDWAPDRVRWRVCICGCLLYTSDAADEED